MPRYEDGKTFWQVARAGATVTVTTGKLGNKGRTSSRSLPSAAAAKAHHDELVIGKLRAGFALVDEAEPEAVVADASADDRIAALEAEIADAPEDVESWLVYGDLLQKRGDPRGELGALLRAADGNPRGKLALTKYFAQHAPTLLGTLAKHVPDVRDPLAPPFIWRHGFIYRAELASAAVADELFAHPSGRLVVELVVRGDALGVLDAIARHAPPALRELDVFARAELDLGELWPAVARLHRLYITARAFELGALELPELQRARFLGLGLSASCMAAIASAPWPRLERLDLRVGLGDDPATFEDIQPLLVRADMPALTHLKIRGAPFAGSIARTLAAGPLAAQLVVLDLSHGTITPRDVEVLATMKPRFASLRELWIPKAALWGNGAKLLEGIAKHVITDERSPVDTLAQELA